MHGIYEKKENLRGVLKNLGLLKFAATIYNIKWSVRHLRCQVMASRRKHGYKDKKYIEMKEFANIHNGERCFVICTGPSLTIQDVEMLGGEYTFSMNSITKLFDSTKWRPTYYVIQDPDAYANIEKELLKYQSFKRFASDLLIKQMQIKNDFIEYPFDLLNHSGGFHFKPKFRFSGNAYEIVYNTCSVTGSILQLAIYMGFREIYLLGCDCNYLGEKKHFAKVEYEDKAREKLEDTTQKMLMGYQMAKEYADAHDIKIYNATRGGKLEVFERVDFDELMSEKGQGI